MLRFIITVAFRNMLRQKRRSFLTFFLIVIAYLLVSVSLSIGEGSYSLIIKNFTSNFTGHVHIQKEGYSDKPSSFSALSNLEELKPILNDQPGLKSWSPRILSSALAYGSDKTAPSQIFGIDLEKERQTTDFLNKLAKDFHLKEKDGIAPVLMSQTLFKKLNLEIGSELILIGSGYDGSIANDRFYVKEVLQHEDFIGPWSVIMSLDKADEFLSLEGSIHQIIISEKEFGTAKSLQESLQKATTHIKDIEVLSWQEVAKEFYTSMLADKKGNEVSLVIIVLMAVLTVLNTVLMAVLERIPEFGLLRAIGTKSSLIVSLIFMEVLFLAFFACLVGLILAFFVNLWFVKVGVAFPTSFEVGGMTFERITGEISLYTLGTPFLIVLLSCLVASIYPALKAISQDPVTSLRSK